MKDAKVLFVAVFDSNGKSTNNSQLRELSKICNCSSFNYRVVESVIGRRRRDDLLLKSVVKLKYDLVIFAKCNGISNDIIRKITEISKTCLWFMDPLVTYNNPEFLEKTKVCSFFICDKKNVLALAKEINKRSIAICEGFDSLVDIQHDVEKEYDVSFIGNLYGDRKRVLGEISRGVIVKSNAFGPNHSIEVSKSKINLNLCTSLGASDRVYKVLGAGGFLISDDWIGRSDYLESGKDIIIFKDIVDLNEKIEYYLENEDERLRIATSGARSVKKLSRGVWAFKVLDFCLNEN